MLSVRGPLFKAGLAAAAVGWQECCMKWIPQAVVKVLSGICIYMYVKYIRISVALWFKHIPGASL